MDSKNKLLIVDDETIGRQLLEAIFLSDDYQLEFADNGKNALKYLENNLPDLILMDVMMPELDGFEVCKKVRSDETLKSIPIILITALDDRDSRKRGLEAGANDYISKPFDRIEIETKVKNLLQLGFNESTVAKVPDKKPDHSDGDEISYFINLITESQRPLKSNILQYVGDFFHIEYKTNISGSNIFWFIHCKNSLYFLYIENTPPQIQNNLINLLITSFISRTIQSGQFKDAPDLVKQLNHFLSEKISLSKITSVKKIDLGLSLIIIDRNSGNIHLSGFNQSILLFGDNSFTKISFDHLELFPNIETRFNSTTFSLQSQSEIFLLNNNLFGLFEQNGYFENDCALLNGFLSGKISHTMKEQEESFRKLFEKTLLPAEKTNNIELIGIKI